MLALAASALSYRDKRARQDATVEFSAAAASLAVRLKCPEIYSGDHIGDASLIELELPEVVFAKR